MMIRPTSFVLLAALGAAAVSGCREQPAGPVSAGPVSPASADADELGKLPGLSQTGDRRLLAERARIIEEAGTPEQLLRPGIAEAENAAAVLAGLFPPGRARALLEQSDELLPDGRYRLNPIELERAIRFRIRLAREHEQVRQALGRFQCRFELRYDLGLRADLGFIDVVRLGARLEGFSAAEWLAGGDLNAAIDSIGRILRLAACLAEEKHPTTRLQAAAVRREGLALLGRIVEHRTLALEHLKRLEPMMREHLAAWAPDAHAWIGDRALGMYAYELVRAGRCRELLTDEEIDRFRQEGILDELPAAAARAANDDELFYLQAMRSVVDACRRPYFQRIAVFEAIDRDGRQKEREPDYPLVAVRLLLPDVPQGHLVQARDRAACEVWALALGLAVGRDAPGEQISPVSGRAYRVVRQEGRIEVRDPADQGEPPLAAVVPDLAPSGPTGTRTP